MGGGDKSHFTRRAKRRKTPEITVHDVMALSSSVTVTFIFRQLSVMYFSHLTLTNKMFPNSVWVVFTCKLRPDLFLVMHIISMAEAAWNLIAKFALLKKKNWWEEAGG